mmetsp:Transcript_82063/g.163958  ORF Transcript_82063/g.163958 Transcript_82063/m.163958 type:complete len:203 (+) Transcript_82063:121-729(+)
MSTAPVVADVLGGVLVFESAVSLFQGGAGGTPPRAFPCERQCTTAALGAVGGGCTTAAVGAASADVATCPLRPPSSLRCLIARVICCISSCLRRQFPCQELWASSAALESWLLGRVFPDTKRPALFVLLCAPDLTADQPYSPPACATKAVRRFVSLLKGLRFGFDVSLRQTRWCGPSLSAANPRPHRGHRSRPSSAPPPPPP